MQEVKKLFEPIKIGQMKLKNRIMLAAMVANFADEDGFVTDRLKAYHANIARGGCGLNVTESSHVSLEGKRITCGLGAYDDKLIPGLRELTDAVHAKGGKIAQQIHHGGRECSSAITGLQPIGPSSLTSRFSAISKKTDVPRQMTLEDIEIVISKFGEAGQRAKEAGCTGIICSGLEVEELKQSLGSAFIAVTPGIRPAWEEVENADQQRVMTPALAVEKGADYLVIGRPIRDAADPRAAAIRIAGEISSALS